MMMNPLLVDLSGIMSGTETIKYSIHRPLHVTIVAICLSSGNHSFIQSSVLVFQCSYSIP